MQMRVKMQQPAYKCEKMQMRALFVNGPIPDMAHLYFAFCPSLKGSMITFMYVTVSGKKKC